MKKKVTDNIVVMALFALSMAFLSTHARAIDLEAGIAVTQAPIYHRAKEHIYGTVRISDSFKINADYLVVIDFTHMSMLFAKDPNYGINSLGISTKTTF